MNIWHRSLATPSRRGLWTAVCFVLSFIGLLPSISAQAQTDTRPDLYYLLIDRSTSLVGNNLVKPIRGAIIEFVGTASPNSEVRMDLFANSVERGSWTGVGTSVKGDIHDFFRERFDEKKFGSATRLYDSIGEAIDRILPVAGNYRTIHIVILTDGDNTVDGKIKDWAGVCEKVAKLKAVRPDAIVELYSLGVQVTKTPPTDCGISLIKRPNAKEGFDIKPAAPPVVVVPLLANFRVMPEKPRAGENAQLLDTSAGGPTKWKWEIQGVGTRTEQHPLVKFDAKGNYEVKLTVFRDDKEHSTARRVEVLPPLPPAEYSAKPEAVKLGETVVLEAMETREGWKHSWVIGGDIRREGARIEWKTDREGVVSVTHTVTADGQTNSASHKPIYVGENIPVVASFSWFPTQPTVNQEVKFSDESTGGPTKWLWKFHDNKTSEERSPTRTFDRVGEFDVTLTASRGDKTNSVTRQIKVVAEQIVPPIAFFNHEPKVFGKDTVVRFKAFEKRADCTHYWTVDGATLASNKAIVEWTATRAGTVTVIHRVVTPETEATHSETIGAVGAAKAMFSASPTGGRAPLTVKFEDNSEGNITAYAWDFGNGGTSTDKKPCYTYEWKQGTKGKLERQFVWNPIESFQLFHEGLWGEARQYTVRLTVKDALGDFTTSPEPVIISIKPPLIWKDYVSAMVATVLALAAIVLFLIQRWCYENLYGTLEWRTSNDSGAIGLRGRSFNLRKAGIKNWIPTKRWTIRRRRKQYPKLFCDGKEHAELKNGVVIKDVEGADFTFKTSLENHRNRRNQ